MRLPTKLYNPIWVTIVAVITCGFHTTFSQVSGTVVEASKNKPITGVEVFFDQCSVYSTTDEEGHFWIERPVSGFLSLVLYKEGYELYSSPMRIEAGKAYTLNLELTPLKKKTEGLKVSLSDQVDIGYRVVSYQLDSKKKFTRFQGLRDAELSQQVEWEQKRKDVFEGSLRHWLTTLASDSDVGYEVKVNGQAVERASLIAETNLDGYYRMTLPGPTEVNYRGKKSQLSANGTLDVSANGLLLNGDQLKVSGPMATHRLPFDYEPIEGDIGEVFAELMKRYYEKVYVHTDKPYYYQGEPMWFKAYVNYYDLSLRDSLSKVLYVELISPEKEIVMEKMVKIESGMAVGDFILPDTLKRGDYFLRAYTSLQRNFGDGQLYVKHIPILGITEKVDASQAVWDTEANSRIVIETDKKVYATREKVTLKIAVNDEDGKPIKGNLSVSVTDASQVVPIKRSSIVDDYNIDDFEIDIPQMLRYPVERGITVQGTYFDEKGKPAKTDLNLVQWKSNNAGMVETGEDGRFEVTGFDFYDSTRIFYSTSSKNLEKGKIILDSRDHPFVRNYDKDLGSLDVLVTESPQRVISEYEVPKDVKILREITIRDTRIESVPKKSTYGAPDKVLQAKDLRMQQVNILYSLIGAMPGLFVEAYPSTGRVVFLRSVGLSVSNTSPVLVTVNDVPQVGDAGDVLARIDPNTVERIELTKRLNPLYGSYGSSGVVAVYLKGTVDSPVVDTAKFFRVDGYESYRPLQSPDYGEKAGHPNVDLRSIMFWEPNLKIANDQVPVSFYAADLESTYKIEAQGVDENNEPIYATQFITVRND
ncbi:MAG: carboxypeptidase regulatory-like domain-containing protein [Cyclobacteriaceae bacterium]|nr:carboxypeptidase regulatory-like domain-containing protein [Cyclobacteriaceae bacterium]